LGEIRGRLQGAELEVRRERVWTERHPWPLGLSVALILLASMLRPGRLRLPGAALSLAFGIIIARPAVAADMDLATDLAARQADAPDDLLLAEQLGQALFEAGRFNQAHQVLAGVAERTLDADQRNRARTNAGLAAYQAGRLTQAVEDWQRVLQDEPEHPAASANAQAVQQEIRRRMGQETPPDGNQGQDGQQQDGQQQDGQQQDGQQQDGQQQDGQQQDGQQQDGQQQDGQQDDPLPTDGTRPDDPEADSMATEAPGQRGEIDEKGPAEAEGQADADPASIASRDTGAGDGEDAPPLGRPGEISPEEAIRLLEGVEEGTPRVPATRHRPGDKDW
ncbi:MAG: hypothetical protein VX000_06470, partial [Myxococcota bacterium]|nr:hypothetical protein [Myxococcota bacterium]